MRKNKNELITNEDDLIDEIVETFECAEKKYKENDQFKRALYSPTSGDNMNTINIQMNKNFSDFYEVIQQEKSKNPKRIINFMKKYLYMYQTIASNFKELEIRNDAYDLLGRKLQDCHSVWFKDECEYNQEIVDEFHNLIVENWSKL